MINPSGRPAKCRLDTTFSEETRQEMLSKLPPGLIQETNQVPTLGISQVVSPDRDSPDSNLDPGGRSVFHCLRNEFEV